MAGIFPTTKDIYIELNGRKLAVAQSYRVKSSRDSRYVESFGFSEPIGTVAGRTKHQIELSRVYVSDKNYSDGIDFYSLSDFNLVIVKPDRKIIYSGCQWLGISEQAGADDLMVESMTAVAAARTEIRG